MFEWHISNHYNVNKGTEQFGRKVLCLNGTLVTCRSRGGGNPAQLESRRDDT